MQNQPQRGVYVSGRGVILGQGIALADIWDHVAADQWLTAHHVSEEELIRQASLEPQDAHILDRHQLLALAAVEIAWREADLPSTRNPLRGKSQKTRIPSMGCIGGSALGGLVSFETESNTRPSPYSLPRWRGNAIPACVSVRYGLGGYSLALNAASATGAQAILTAGILIQSGILEAVVVVCADPYPSPHIRKAMMKNGSVSKDLSGQPLTLDRSGMIPREGAAAIVLESEESLRARGRRPICEWRGGSCLSEAYHLMAPDPTGQCLLELLGRHVSFEKLNRQQPWISLHATGTRLFDAIEFRAVHDFFKDTSPWISAMKRSTGHTLSAAGVLDAVLVSEGLRRKEWPAFPSQIDPDLFPYPTPSKPLTRPEVCLQIGQGMGGVVVLNEWLHGDALESRSRFNSRMV
jgi:3-oxoacyl-[acyl-carrier-protein] synthase II